MPKNELALYTTVYPGAIQFFREWLTSVERQQDQRFDLWIGLDAVSEADLSLLAGHSLAANYLCKKEGETPIQLRTRAIRTLRDQYLGVVFTDSDDILEANRVDYARAGLRTAEVVGCAMTIINEGGQDIGRQATIPSGCRCDEFLARSNIFGLSNTAYSQRALRALSEPPADCQLMDWYLITQIWGAALTLAFDGRVGMRYRQYGQNTARIVPPFLPGQIKLATRLVGTHYEMVNEISGRFRAEVRDRLREATEGLILFRDRVVADPERLEDYCTMISSIDRSWLWWEMVNYPVGK